MSANHVTPPAGAGPTCAVFAPLLPLLSLGRLDAEETAVVHAHAAACASCGPALADYDALREALRRGELEESPEGPFRPSTMEKIMATKEPSASPAPIYSPERVSRRGALLSHLAAVLVVALLAGVLFATHSLGGTALSGPTPTATTLLATTTPPTSGLTQTNWTLTRFVVNGRDQLLVPSRAPTLRFDPHDGQFAGRGGCNGYGGSYTIAGETLHFSSLGFTQMYCQASAGPGASLMEQESAYFQALPGVKRYHLDGNTLTLTSDDGSVQFTFRAS